MSGTLSTSNPDITINSSTSVFGDINPDEIVLNIDNPFEIEISEEADEQDAVLDLTLITDYGYEFETEIIISITYTTSSEDNIGLIDRIYQLQNYPNPFNPSTTISFELDTEISEDTEICIYNLKGQKIKTFPIPNSSLLIPNQVVWDGKDENNQPVGSGIYFYKLKTGKFEETRKMILIK